MIGEQTLANVYLVDQIEVAILQLVFVARYDGRALNAHRGEQGPRDRLAHLAAAAAVGRIRPTPLIGRKICK